MIIEVFGKPVAQPRPRITVKGSFPHAYIPEKHAIHAWKALIQDKVSDVADSFEESLWPDHLSGFVVDLVFILPRPKSLPKKVVEHIKKPDIDNLCKAVLDAMSGIIYKDDSQVTKLTAQKIYGEDIGCRIEVL
jgi:Holliday junction resolvase RusA-like endonuclease